MGGILFLIAAALGKSLLIDGQNAYAHIGEFFFRTNMVIFGQLLETNYYAMVRTWAFFPLKETRNLKYLKLF